MRQSQAHAEFFRAEALPAAEQQRFEAAARESLEAQAKLEREEDKADFDLFVSAYQASILAISN
ncbi:glutamate--cysteine ligase [compost metagenome]